MVTLLWNLKTTLSAPNGKENTSVSVVKLVTENQNDGDNTTDSVFNSLNEMQRTLLKRHKMQFLLCTNQLERPNLWSKKVVPVKVNYQLLQMCREILNSHIIWSKNVVLVKNEAHVQKDVELPQTTNKQGGASVNDSHKTVQCDFEQDASQESVDKLICVMIVLKKNWQIMFVNMTTGYLSRNEKST